jgi:hypothetical protein
MWFLGMSENKRQFATPNQTGLSTQANAAASFFSRELPSTWLLNTELIASKNVMCQSQIPNFAAGALTRRNAECWGADATLI